MLEKNKTRRLIWINRIAAGSVVRGLGSRHGNQARAQRPPNWLMAMPSSIHTLNGSANVV